MFSTVNSLSSLAIAPSKPFAGASCSARVTHRESLSITLVTAEGDTVSIKGKTDTVYAGNTYAGLASSGARTAGQLQSSSELTSGQSFNISVHGHFDEQEQADIGKAIQTVKNMWNDFSSGNTDAAIAHVSDFEGIQTLQQADIDMAYDRTVQEETQQAPTGLMAPKTWTNAASAPTDPLNLPIPDLPTTRTIRHRIPGD